MNQNKNNQIKLGKFVNTHGIKGEIRLLSKFDYTEELQPGKVVSIKDKEFVITNNRKHKNFTLLTFEGIDNINDIEFLKGNDIYGEGNSKELSVPEYVGYKVNIGDSEVGEVIDYFKQGTTWSLIVKLNEDKKTNIPFVDEFIDSIEENIIYLKDDRLI